jgi:hypothetical protein
VPNADPDQDGLDNRTEFAFGTNPNAAGGTTGHSAVAGQGTLEIRWTARTDASVAYQVTTSPTLGATPAPWAPVSAMTEVMTVPDVTVPAGYERRRVTVPVDAAKGFFRVEATLLPTAIP